MRLIINNLKKIGYEHRRTIIRMVILFVILIVGGVFYTGNEKITATCEDTDGSNMYLKGSILYTDAKGSHVDEDYCAVGEKQLYEMTCKRTAFLSRNLIPEKKTVDCKNGCVNGSCSK
jgi:hypothetical protein